MTKNVRLKKMVFISSMSVIGVILQFISLPFPFFPFLKFDFSDLVILISMFLYGPIGGVATAAMRSILHLFLTGMEPTNFIGDMASFLASLCYTYPIYFFFTKKECLTVKNKEKILGLSLGTFLMTIFMSIANYFVLTPMYLYFFHLNEHELLNMKLSTYIAVGIIPFNLIKGLIVSLVFLVVFHKLLPWLSEKQFYAKQATRYHVK